MIKERLNRAALFEKEIKQAADFLSQGLSPIILEAQGRREDALLLHYVLGVLNENKLMGQVDTRIKELKRGEAGRGASGKEIQEELNVTQRSNQPQPNFFHLVEPEFQLDQPIINKSMLNEFFEKSLEEKIDEWHRIFQGRGKSAERKRNKLLSREASRWWNDFLKSMGFTQKERTRRLYLKAAVAIRRLNEAGIVGVLYRDLTGEDWEKFVKFMKEFDEFQKEPYIDPYGSDVVIFPTEKSYEIAQVRGIKEQT